MLGYFILYLLCIRKGDGAIRTGTEEVGTILVDKDPRDSRIKRSEHVTFVKRRCALFTSCDEIGDELMQKSNRGLRVGGQRGERPTYRE